MPTRIPTTHLRKHLQHCITNGATPRGIDHACNLPEGTTLRILRGQETVRHATATKLAKATPHMAGHTPAWPYGRRIRALRANGMLLTQFEEAGFTTVTIIDLCADKKPTIRVTTARALDTLWDKHKNDPHREPSPRIKTRHWPTPWDWDDIDDPDENPQARRIAETTSPRELINALIEHHGTITTVAQHTGVTLSTLCHNRTKNRANTDTMSTLRRHWCDLHHLPVPQVEDMPIPDDVRETMTRWAKEAGLRYQTLNQADVKKGTIPTRLSAAATLGLPVTMVTKIVEGRGKISPQDLDRVRTALEMAPEVAA